MTLTQTSDHESPTPPRAQGRPASAAYWRSRLAGMAEKTCIPTDLPGGGDAATAIHAMRLPTSLADRLDHLSRHQLAALHVLLAAGLVALLRRHTGGGEVVVGQPTMPTAQECPNTMVVLRSCPSAETTFRQLVGELKATIVEAVEHQDYPVALLADELGRSAAEGENPYFDVALELAGLHEPCFAATVPVRILLTAARDDVGVGLTVRYDGGRFAPGSIARFAAQYVSLLEMASAEPDRPLADFVLHTADDKAVVAASNATGAEFDTEATIHGLFERQASLTPDAVALVGPAGSVTYAELDERSNRLARLLQDRGVAPDDVVGVMAERSVEVVVGIFAILKAGGAYLPLDPSYPSARLSYVVADSGMRLLLAQSRLSPEGGAGIEVVDLDAAESYEASPEPLGPASKADDLAYVIYTSGSTGNPKGVMVEHRSVVNRLAWMQRAYPLGPGDVILQKTSISFDVSVWELFWWSFTGASLALLEPGGEKDPVAIVDAVEVHRVTTMHFVPSMLTMFLAHVERRRAAGRLSSVRQVFTSGEALGRHHVTRFADVVAGARLVNLYGPTEATVDVTHHACDGPEPRARVPIGRPIDNTRLYILDNALRPLPVGMAGELYIAGTGVARGYLRRPELTRDRFVDGATVGEDRLYRTGDLARWLPDGTVDYLGRCDLQVKVRGFRVELGEIEERLRAHPEVEEAAVIAHDDGFQTALRGFVVLRADVPEQTLKGHLRLTLPEYMVPGQLVALHRLPTTPNGKLDRAALARPLPRRRPATARVAPRNRREETLAAIWREVLGVPEVGVLDNFFALGGNSIHFVSVLARARAAGLSFTFQQLFTNQTIEALARSLGGDEGGLAGAESPAGEARAALDGPFELLSEADRGKVPAGVEDGYPLSHLQAGLIFQTEITGASGQYHDVLGYLIRGSFDAGAFEQAVRAMVRRHPVLRTTYHLTGFSEFIQLVHRELPPPLTVTDLRRLGREEQERFNEEWVGREKARPFRWDEGGLVTLHVQVLTDDLFRYTLSQHNSALDGWSISLLHTQLFELYYQLRDGGSPDTHEVDTQVRSFIGLERQAVAAAASRDFWMAVLDGTVSTEVPRRPGAEETDDFEVVLHDIPLPAGLTERIDALADALSVPVKDVLLAAHVKVLSMVAGEREVMTGYEHSGRPELAGAEAALGLFLNTLPLRVALADGSWEGLVRQIYRAEADLLPHRRYPMARMKQDLATQRTLFETTFNFTHFYLLKKLRDLPEFDLLDMRVDSETEFVFRTEVSRHFFDDDIRLCLHYHTHLFDAEQIDRIGGYFVRALELMTSRPTASHHEQSLASSEELEQLDRFAGRGVGVLDEAYRSLVAGWDDVRVDVVDDHLPAPIGTPGEIVLSGVVAGDRHRLRTGDRGRWTADGHLEVVDRAGSGAGEAQPTAVAAAAGPTSAVAPPASSTGRQIAAAWAQVLGVAADEIGPADDFFELGGNSLSALRVVLELDGLVTLTDLTRHSRLEGLARVVNQREQGAEELVQLLSSTAAGTRWALVCVPYPAGHPINFQPLAEAMEELTSDVAVYAVEQPGHDPSRPGAFVGVSETARLLVEEIGDKVTTPIVLWGHCGGASITLELARQLEDEGFDLRHVFVGSKLLPIPSDMRESIEMIEGWSDDDITRYMVDETGYDLDGLAQHHTGFFAEVFRHDVLNGYRFFLDACHRQEWTIRAPLTFVVAADDAALAHHATEYGRWGLLADDVRLAVVPQGGHYFVRTNPTQTAELIHRVWEATPTELEA